MGSRSRSRSRSMLDCMIPICLFGNRKNKHNKRQQIPGQKDGKKEPLLKNKQLTLQECILNSPNFNKSTPSPSASSNKRVHPNPSFVNENVSMKTFLLGDHLMNPLFENDNDDEEGMKRTKKRVSFRMPEVADVFILTSESPDVQASDTILKC